MVYSLCAEVVVCCVYMAPDDDCRLAEIYSLGGNAEKSHERSSRFGAVKKRVVCYPATFVVEEEPSYVRTATELRTACTMTSVRLNTAAVLYLFFCRHLMSLLLSLSLSLPLSCQLMSTHVRPWLLPYVSRAAFCIVAWNLLYNCCDYDYFKYYYDYYIRLMLVIVNMVPIWLWSTVWLLWM